MIVIRIKVSKLFHSWKDNIFPLFEIKEITNLSNLMIAQEVPVTESHPVFVTCLSFVLAIHCITPYPFSCFVEEVTDVICNLPVVGPGAWAVKGQGHSAAMKHRYTISWDPVCERDFQNFFSRSQIHCSNTHWRLWYLNIGKETACKDWYQEEKTKQNKLKWSPSWWLQTKTVCYAKESESTIYRIQALHKSQNLRILLWCSLCRSLLLSEF